MAMQNQRQVYGETLVKLGRENNRIVVLEADLGKSTMTCLFQSAYPERYFEMGIAEQNMTSFAAGLSLTGKIPFVNSFAVFASGRAYDQIRQCIGIPGLNVKIIGSSSGLSDFGDGSTHQAVEDVAIMRAIPGMTVLSPVDGIETEKIIREIVRYNGPVYVRINRNPLPDIFPQEQEFAIGKPILIRDGTDIVVFACGVMVSVAIKAAQILDKEGISLKVVNVSSLKPLDKNDILAFAGGMKGIITAEEHSIIGGLASIICYVFKGINVPIKTIAIQDMYGQSAQTYEELLDHYKLTDAKIIQAACGILGR